jgi:hypothetical protein
MLKGLMPLSVVRPTYTGGAQRLLPGSVVALKSVANGDYVCGSPLTANCTTVGQPESYQVVDAGNGNIALLSLANNEYVSADNGGNSSRIHLPRLMRKTETSGCWPRPMTNMCLPGRAP